ncbi:UNVERIFIED_CONTAM: hypothetical protein Sradi_0835200 [Sesamum radiatum]|uniref:Reverse transcriptase domain-containing protein n=1 Tax=Sesamum radiatum TaxID=300843 RepID=A0AAW2VVV5_SESRA
MSCVTPVSFSFLLNGEQFGFLRPRRGLHQGDPLSPYLFLFCAEAFSGLILKEEVEGRIHGVAVSRGAPPISHLLFADDTLIFCEASTEGLRCINDILITYERGSGLKINLQKSAMVVSRNVEVNKRVELADILGVEVVEKHDKYLGLPTVAEKSKRELFEGIKDRFWRKLHSWSAKLLSQAGRAVLIKTVLQTIPNYAMSFFRFPNSTLKELEGILADFFWQGGNVTKIHWIAWHKLCLPKEQGGLGFKRLREFNLALLTKQVLSSKYFRGSTFFEAKLGSTPSYTWRSIWATRDILAAGLHWRVGNGNSIRVLGHPWLPRPMTFQLIRRHFSLTEHSKVAQLILASNEWNEPLIRAEFSPEDTGCILSISPRGQEVEDELIWHYEAHGRFSVRSAYLLASTLREDGAGSNPRVGWQFIWKSKAPPKVLMFAWRCVHNSLPTADNEEEDDLNGGCAGCFAIEENIIHSLLHCSFARLVWAISGLPWCVIGSDELDVERWFRSVNSKLMREQWDLFLILCWALWWARNQRIFEGISVEVSTVVCLARRSN